jgi:hypothetical protein
MMDVLMIGVGRESVYGDVTTDHVTITLFDFVEGTRVRLLLLLLHSSIVSRYNRITSFTVSTGLKLLSLVTR